MLAGFLGSGVEFTEALTIILAVGVTRGWRSSLLGAAAAVAILAALLVVIGLPLVQIIQIAWVQVLIGLFMLLFGIRWLRKAILRYAGLKALHDEAESYAKEVEVLKGAGKLTQGLDHVGFATSFSGTFIEGLEVVFIVITFGLGAHSLPSTVLGAAAALVLVAALGIIGHRPLSQVPENTMKFAVGVLLTSFGAFWVGEGLGVHWPQADLSIVYTAGLLLLFSWAVIAWVVRCLAPAVEGVGK